MRIEAYPCRLPNLGVTIDSEEWPHTEEGAGHWWDTFTGRELGYKEQGRETPEFYEELALAREIIKKHYPNIEELTHLRFEELQKAIKDFKTGLNV